MQENHTYRAYGLTVRAEFPLPELLETGDGEPDVIVRYGWVPRAIDDATVRKVRFEAAPGRFLLRVDGIARYYVHDGKEIVIERYSGSPAEDIRLFLLGSVFAALLYQRGNMVLHGAAVAVNGHGIIFAGGSAAGKSTLAAKFYRKGYHVLADDFCVIRPQGRDAPLLVPGFPRLMLWEDAVKRLGEKVTGLARVRSKLNKYALPVIDTFYREQLPLLRIYMLDVQNTPEISVTRLEGISKMKYLIANTYHIGFLQGLAEKQLHLQQCAELAKKVKMCRVIRADAGFYVDRLASLLEKEIISQ